MIRHVLLQLQRKSGLGRLHGDSYQPGERMLGPSLGVAVLAHHQHPRITAPRRPVQVVFVAFVLNQEKMKKRTNMNAYWRGILAHFVFN